MKIKPVDIEIPNNFKFGLVASFVDTPGFLSCLKQARERLGIENIIPREEAESLFLNFRSQSGKLDIKIISDSKVPETFKKLKRNYFDVFGDIYQTYQGLYPYFGDVILFSTISNLVKECDIKTAPLFFHNWELNSNLGLSDFGFAKGAITLYPFTTDQEVLEVLHDYRKGLKIPDTIANIHRDRKRYWLNQPIKNGGKGQSHYEIALIEANGNSSLAHNSVRGIGASIKQYRDRLDVQL